MKTSELNDFFLVKIRKQRTVKYCFCTKNNKYTEGGDLEIFELIF